MTSLYYGMLVQAGVPADEKTVRSTATPAETDAPPAVQDDQPEMGEVETDPNPNLGMTPRQLASDWHEGQRGVDDKEIMRVAAGTDNNAIINRQVSTAGLAPSLEAAG